MQSDHSFSQFSCRVVSHHGLLIIYFVIFVNVHILLVTIVPNKNAGVRHYSAKVRATLTSEQRHVYETYFAGLKLRTCKCSILVARDSAT